MLLVASATFAFTVLGGLVALRFSDKLHLVLGFSAGAIVGVAFLELIPEAVELAEGTRDVHLVLQMSALGFVAYLLLDRFVAGGHGHGGHGHGGHAHDHHPHGGHPDAHDAHARDLLHTRAGLMRGAIGAGSLSTHSLLDGLAIGVAYGASPQVGLIVATAVILHDFSDGMNTVNVVLKNGGSRALAFRWLLLDAAAPVLGILLAGFVRLAPADLALVLGLFAGFFLYIGASDLIPESFHSHPKWPTSALTVLGFLLMFAITQFGHGH